MNKPHQLKTLYYGLLKYTNFFSYYNGGRMLWITWLKNTLEHDKLCFTIKFVKILWSCLCNSHWSYSGPNTLSWSLTIYLFLQKNRYSLSKLIISFVFLNAINPASICLVLWYISLSQSIKMKQSLLVCCI